MPEALIQFSFNSGEWAPALNARTDLLKYRNGASLLRNFFIDYRGGATTRPGTRFILPTKLSSTARLIPFSASATVAYVLEFGNNYIRPFVNGAPVLETAQSITSATTANPGVFTKNAHGYSDGDWVYASGFTGSGWTGLNSNYYIVDTLTVNTFSLTDLLGNPISTLGFAAFSAGTVARVFTLLNSPYTASEVGGIKFAQNVSRMVLCHPNHVPYELILGSTPTSWTISAITFGSSAVAPSAGLALSSTFAGGTVNYAYVVTSVDANGEESGPSAFITGALASDIRTTAGTNTISWTAVSGAVSYNVYRAAIRYGSAVPAGSAFGYQGFATSTTFIDSNIAPDFSQTPPVPQNPFSGSGLASITVNTPGSFSGSFGPVSIGGGGGAAALATASITSIAISVAGTGYTAGGAGTIPGTGGAVVRIDSVDFSGAILAVTLVNRGAVQTPTSCPSSFTFTHSPGVDAVFTLTWGVATVDLTSPGTGYGAPPAVTVAGTGGTFTAVVGAPSSGNPTVPGFFQQRLVLAGPVSSPQQFNMSRPGAQYNFDISIIAQAADALSGTLVSGQLNTIQSMVSQPFGLVMYTDKLAYLINGGTPGAAVTPFALVANPQAYNGANFMPPIIANDHMLYVQAKGSIVRDSVFNWSKQVYTGVDVSMLSSHLFYGYTLHEWAWSEEPYKVVWAIRSDGILLTLTFLPEQELIAWTHSDTTGSFQSVASIVETISSGVAVDAIYFIVQRTVNGSTRQYIERLADIPAPQTLGNSWQVDSGLLYSGAATLSFSGAQHLAGLTVTGVATTDGAASTTAIIPPFTMPTNGSFTLTAPAAPATGYTRVVIGIAFTAQLQTVALDAGEPTVQAALKKINNIDVRVREALGLKIGGDFDSLVPMKDLVVGNVSSMLTGLESQRVTDLVTGDARTYINPSFNVPGQFCIQIDEPYPASILGLITDVTMGDTGTTRRK